VNAFTIQDVLDSTGAVLVRGDARMTVTGVSTDTRTLERGDLFLALSGPNFDGNSYATAALDAGAGGLVLRGGEGDALAGFPGEAPIARHRDPRRALGDLAAWHRSRLDAAVVGITGSCGKTTVKNILAELLAAKLSTVSSPSSYNNDVGVPHTLLLADDTTQALVVEMGTNHPGEIAALCRIARPEGGVITNIGASHLEGLETIDGVAREKSALAASLPREGFLVLEAHGRYTPMIRSTTAARVITVSVDGDGDLDATDVVFHGAGTSFRFEGHEVTVPLLGTHNVLNLLCALATCRGLGLDIEDLLPHMSGLSGGRQRMERLELGGITVLDDSYNANPDSASAAVRVLKGMHGHDRRVLVLGDMLELGQFAAEAHHALGMEAAEAGIDRLVLVGELAAAAAAGALEGGLARGDLAHFADVETAAEAAPDLFEEGDLVLVKGSREVKLERLVAAVRGRWGEEAPC
jgi:UDP-N-acetylmuramoyl-tripeptide--D-alanyl-D-alanine ligase